MTRPTTTLAALTAAAALLLTGCTQQAPEPQPTQATTQTPSPTPTTTLGPYEAEAPKDQATAIKDATAAFEQMLAITAEMDAKPGNTEGLDQIATGPALEALEKSNQDLAKAGAQASGAMTFELDPDGSYTAPSANGQGEKTEHGTATLKGCVDRSAQSLTNKDGSKWSGEGLRYETEVVAVYSRDTHRWLIKDFEFLSEGTC